MPALRKDELNTRGILCDQVFTVHRRDRTTEGLTVYALTKKGAALLSRSVAEGTFRKTYAAFVTADHGLPEEGEMRDWLWFDRRRDKAFVADSPRPGAKEAVLRYRLEREFLWREKTVTEARVELETGRTHQIRVQFASRRSPLVGDGKYGSRLNRKGPSLFSVTLEFPWEGSIQTFTRPAEF
jgi:23S rRNA pseudouridine1911/1915/1917 synthase